jgi:predicted transcriptional regulator
MYVAAWKQASVVQNADLKMLALDQKCTGKYVRSRKIRAHAIHSVNGNSEKEIPYLLYELTQ